jgi:antibiotic biosynthesis monooxygenase (ABM) superfamily enzyme
VTSVTASSQTVTLVTQTRVLPGRDAEFAAWQQRVNDALAAVRGYMDHTVTAPTPPVQLDWVIVQRFRSVDDARAWLQSPARQRLVAEIQPILVGTDDIHLFKDDAAGPPATSVSAVISMHVTPGLEPKFRAWQRKMAAAEATFPGFQGDKLEPPIAGVQDDWVCIVRFDSDEHLQAWLTSAERQRLLDEGKSLSAESHIRTVRGGFEGWFTFGGTAAAPAWKQNMIVLLVLYPVVFLFGYWVGTPLLGKALGLPFWLVLFIGNAFSVILTGYLLIPQASRAFMRWLTPLPNAPKWTTAAGTALVVALYVVCLLAFSRFP